MTLNFEPASADLLKQRVFELRPRQIVRVGGLFIVRGDGEWEWLRAQGVPSPAIWTRARVWAELGSCTLARAVRKLSRLQEANSLTTA